MLKLRGNTSDSRMGGSSNLKSNWLTSDELLLQPWFLSQRVQLAIQSLVPPSYKKRMHNFFDDYGCMICTNNELYGANGMCRHCNANVRSMLRASARRHLKNILSRRVDLDLLRQARLAKKLLRGFSIKNRAASQRRRLDAAHSSNPVDEMLGPRGG